MRFIFLGICAFAAICAVIPSQAEATCRRSCNRSCVGVQFNVIPRPVITIDNHVPVGRRVVYYPVREVVAYPVYVVQPRPVIAPQITFSWFFG